jgi:5-formyltetrahydrofolate cyclo-ligase
MPGKEVSTNEIVRDALNSGKQVFVPYIYELNVGKEKDKVMDMLRLRDESDLDSLKPDAWGIPTLSADSVQRRDNALGGDGIESDNASPRLDLIFVPSVAFDHQRRRLGHGRGFYDRYLERYSSAAIRCGSQMPLLGWCHPFSLAPLTRLTDLVTVGLALKPQLLPETESVPVDDNDWLIDRVIAPI